MSNDMSILVVVWVAISELGCFTVSQQRYYMHAASACLQQSRGCCTDLRVTLADNGPIPLRRLGVRRISAEKVCDYVCDILLLKI